MQRLIIVSNRLPVSVEKRAGNVAVKASVGGVATGLGAFHAAHDSLWVGWAEVAEARLSAGERERIRTELAERHRCVPVFLTAADVRGFYAGFSNGTLWPLFHHFTRYAEFDSKNWAAYERVNRKFCDAVVEIARPGDTIWIQDYQLTLLPKMLRERLPDAAIGFFLHIPFPGFDVFRVLPWRREILEGLLGSDLIGFHTYDYVRGFLSSIRHLLALDEQYGRVVVDERLVTVDAFPMGIDYERYAQGARSSKARKGAERITAGVGGHRVVLSIDRLDYTKGIPERLRAFDEFLDRYPEWRSKVTLVCVAVPSRTKVEEYRKLKEEIERLVGSINGKHGTIDWTPVRYLYRSLSFPTLSGMYAASDVALVTPLRDGMNLIAKEYVAARGDTGGVLVLSEMAGAAQELDEALQVNPYDQDAMVCGAARSARHAGRRTAQANGLDAAPCQSLHGSRDGPRSSWTSLEKVKLTQLGYDEHLLHEPVRERLLASYRAAERRTLLARLRRHTCPLRGHAREGQAVRNGPPTAPATGVGPAQRGRDHLRTSARVARRVARRAAGRSGRRARSVAAQSGTASGAPHFPVTDEWKPRIRPILDLFADRTAGSFVEEKDFSLAWHYRAIHPSLAATRVAELKEALAGITGDLGLAIMEGNKVVEIKLASVGKGHAAHRWMSREDVGFVLAIGDDRTDEDMFEMAPTIAWTIKVGRGLDARALLGQGGQGRS